MKSTSSTVYNYSKLTKETFDLFIKDYESKLSQRKANNWVLYTNDIGIILVDISILRSIYKNIPQVYHSPIHKGKYKAVFSINNRNGLIKAYYNARTNSFDMKKGSELLFTFNSFSSSVFDKIKKYL